MLQRSLFSSRALARPAAAAAAARSQTAPLLHAQARLRAPAIASMRVVPSARWYSEGAKESEEPAEKKEEGSMTPEALREQNEKLQTEKQELSKKLEAKDKDMFKLKDQYLRLLADFKTLQDRQARDHKTAKELAIQKFAADLCDSVDNLDRALAGVPHEKLSAQERSEHVQDLVSLYEGLKMTESMLMETLRNHGVERFDPHGEKFNANEHEVTIMVPHPEHEDNTVVGVEKKGFKLNGRLLRAAQVQVAKNLKKATS